MSGSVDLCAIAAASGYAKVSSVASPNALRVALEAAQPGPVFIEVPILPGVPDDLPRPELSPARVAERLRGWLRAGGDP